MARVFSIDIVFEENVYTALISMREQLHDLYYVVRYMNEDLQRIMTGPQLIFSLHEGLIEPKQLASEQAENLLMCTINALSAHLAAQV